MATSHQLNTSFLLDKVGVSRETCEKLHCYYHLLIDWNKNINLVSRKSIDSSWVRHFLDSAQLWLYAPKETRSWLDFGSGAGFPGMIISIIAQELNPELKVTLVEKNRKKVIFLKEVARKLSLKPRIFCSRVEEIENQSADVISSRAFGSLKVLLEIAYMHKNKRTTNLFPKGKKNNYSKEIIESKECWNFDIREIKNLIEPDSSILIIRNIEFAQ